jgi:hypothetical protein
MKKILSILFSILSLTVIAQVPQGVGYQGVATDANGIELVNQAISIRASVLSASANGTIEWEETHATSTDTFGLFTLTIGQGTSTGNGAQLSFSDISWGTNTHYLKIEMDITGGANYSFMGTNQMMSVPYALYAESANINYDSISNLLSNDSTFLTNVGGGMGGGGCNYAFPDGLNGDAIAWDFYNGDYNVPAGKNLFITNVYTLDGYAFRINGMKIMQEQWGTNTNYGEDGMLKLPLCAKAGDIISNSNLGGPKTFYGILVDEVVEPITYEFDDPGTGFDTYTVPLGKKLFIMNIWAYGGANYNSQLTVDGVVIATEAFNAPSYDESKQLNIPLIINSGSAVSIPENFASFNGYLADENYFAGCGGGGSSAIIDYDSLANLISVDSTFINNVGSGMGVGCDVEYPDGVDGDPITWDLYNNPYTVPVGKNLCITNLFSLGGNFNVYIDGIVISLDYSNYANSKGNLPYFATSGQVVSSDASLVNGTTFNGFLADNNVLPITWDLYNNPYTVPVGKNLYLTNLFSLGGNFNIYIDGITISFDYSNFADSRGSNTFFVSSGQVISSDASLINGTTLNGYLADENYFANCGGGGSSTTTSSNSVGDFSYPDGKEDITPITYFSGIYTPPNNKNLYITSVISNLQISSNSIFTGQGNLGTGQSNAIGHPDLPIIVSETDTVDGDFNGFLVDASVDPITMMLTGAGTYTVPSGKILVILNAHLRYGSLQADGNNLLSGYFNYYGSISGCSPTCFPKNLKAPIFVDENTLLTAGSGNGLPTSGIVTFNGYLMDK